LGNVIPFPSAVTPAGRSHLPSRDARWFLTWEADADVDLQVESGGRPWDPGVSSARNALPGEGLVLDDASSFGPEEYVVTGAARAYPYRVLAHLQGPPRTYWDESTSSTATAVVTWRSRSDRSSCRPRVGGHP